MGLTPSEIGARAEREIAYALERAGWTIYLPVFSPHARVDLVALRSAESLRVQVKSARISRGALVFRVCSNTGNVPRDYRDEIDAFGVYSPDLDRCYVVPIDATATRMCFLRLEPSANGQIKGTRLAADFELRRPG